MPARSSSGSMPATPTARSVWPVRQARPAVSVSTTATLRPMSSCTRSRRARAEASGSSGRSTTWPGVTLEASTPAAAITRPRWFSTIEVGPRRATTRTVSSWIAASRSPGRTRPSALLTTLLVTRTTSPSCRSRRGEQRPEVGALDDLADAVDRPHLHVLGLVVSRCSAATARNGSSRQVERGGGHVGRRRRGRSSRGVRRGSGCRPPRPARPTSRRRCPPASRRAHRPPAGRRSARPPRPRRPRPRSRRAAAGPCRGRGRRR